MIGSSEAGPRIWVVGISGAGKTTVAAWAAARLGVPHLQLDAVIGRRLGRIPGPDVRRVVGELLEREAWVADGNDQVVRDLLRVRATCIVWIDLPRLLVITQVIWRSLGRVLNPRGFRKVNLQALRAWLVRRRDIPWVRSVYAGRQAELSALVDRRCIRLRSRRAVRAWLDSLPRAGEKGA